MTRRLLIPFLALFGVGCTKPAPAPLKSSGTDYLQMTDTIAQYFRQEGYSDWSQVPDGDYYVGLDKYSYYKVTIKKNGDNSQPAECQMMITKSELLYFGGFTKI